MMYLNDIGQYTGLAKKKILDAIEEYIYLYGDLRIVVYKDGKIFHSEIVEIREGRDVIALENDLDNER